MVRHARLGHLAKAAASLVSFGVAPVTPSVEDELRRKIAPPGAAAEPPAFDWLAPRNRVRLDPEVFRRRLQRVKRGSAPGSTG